MKVPVHTPKNIASIMGISKLVKPIPIAIPIGSENTKNPIKEMLWVRGRSLILMPRAKAAKKW